MNFSFGIPNLRDNILMVVSRTASMMLSLVTVSLVTIRFDADLATVFFVLLALHTAITAQDLGVCSGLRIKISEHIQAQNQDMIFVDYSSVKMLFVAITLIWLLVGSFFSASEWLSLDRQYHTIVYLIIWVSLTTLFSTASGHTLLALEYQLVVAKSNLYRSLLQFISLAILYLYQISFEFFLMAYFAPWIWQIFYQEYFVSQTFDRLNIPKKTAILTSFKRVPNLLQYGLQFWLLQLCNIVLVGSEILFINKYVHDEEVLLSTILVKVAHLGIGFVGAMQLTMWGYFARHLRSKNPEAILSATYSQLLVITLISPVVALIFYLIGGDIIHLWTGIEITDSNYLFLPVVIFLVTSAFTIIQNVYVSIGYFKKVLALTAVVCLFKIGVLTLIDDRLNIFEYVFFSSFTMSILALYYFFNSKNNLLT